MKRYYECHITLDPEEHLEDNVLNLGWKYSAIDGDAFLGNKVFAYATKHYASCAFSEHEVIEEMANVAFELKWRGFKVLRQKVELVIYDTKQERQNAV